MRRILVTGAGGAAAISFLNAVTDPRYVLHAADMDPNAAGLYLVPSARRHWIPAAAAPGFADHLLACCRRHGIRVLVPTVDAELLPLARRRRDFEAAGVRLLAASAASLSVCLDKAALIDRCRTHLPCPKTSVLDARCEVDEGSLPAIIKPRRGSGSRGVRRVEAWHQLEQIARDGSLLLQEYLPGDEYSVDVLAEPEGDVLAAVVRHRLKVDSGVAVTAMTVRDPRLEALSAAAVRRTGLSFVANVQWRLDTDGTPRLLEINPRFPGTMPLTIASGIDMPNLCLRLLLGESVTASELRFTPRAMVRTWQEHFVAPSELLALTDPRDAAAPGWEVCA